MATRKPITAERLYAALPTIYKKQDEIQKPTEYPLRRFLGLTQPGWQYLEDKLLGLERLYDPDLTPSQFLDDLASMWGFKFPVSKVAASTGRKVRSGSVWVDNMNPDVVMNSVRSLSLNTINVPVRIDFTSYTDSAPTLSNTHLDAALALAQTLNANNVNVILEMFPYVNGGEGLETDIDPDNVDTFFTNWRNHATRILRALETQNIRANYFNVSSNLVLLETPENSPRWTSLFEHVRSLYKGRIMYRTNWWVSATWDTGAGSSTERYQQKLNLPMFSSPFLDVISIAAYFELTDTRRYTKEELVNCLTAGTTLYGRGQRIYDEVKAFYDTHNKPVFFGELGVGGNEWGASAPWNSDTTGNADGSLTGALAYPEGQQYLFEAYEEVFADNSWFLGFSAFQVTKGDSSYYPVAKPAQGAIANFFDLETPAYNISLTEGEKRQFLDLLPTLYSYKSSKRVFTFLGRYVFGNETEVVTERIDRTASSTGFHTINLSVTVGDDVLNLGEMSTRYALFAENFRPVNHKLNVTFTIIYYEEYDARNASDSQHLESMLETGTDVYATASANDNIYMDGLLSTDTESYTTSSTVDDSLHTNALQEVSTELYGGVQSDATTDFVTTLGSRLSFPNSASRLSSGFRLSSPTTETVLPTNTI